MKITIVFDNCPDKRGLRTGWGFSSLIEVENAPPLLFDTGADGDILLDNMKQLHIDPKQIGAIVISHAHGDHTGGLSSILEINEDAEIYVPASTVTRLPGRKVIMVSQPIQISESVFSTGELKGIEQSLAIKTGKGVLVVAGCSHPGVGTILDAADDHIKQTQRYTGFESSHYHIFAGDTWNTGGNQPHENRPPYYIMAFIMKVQ